MEEKSPTNSGLASQDYLTSIPSGTNILLIEDSGIQAKTIIKLLNEMGYTNVHYCATPTEAVDKIKSSSPQLVLCDWEMPGKSGLEVLKELRQDKDFASIPFVFLTAHSGKDKVIEAIKSGANDYIIKPPNASTVAAKFKTIKLSGS